MYMIRGVGVSEGIVLGKIIKKREYHKNVTKKSIDNVEHEIERVDAAVEKYKEYLAKIYNKTTNIVSEEEAQAYQSHLSILTDSVLISSVKKQIRDQQVNAEWILEEVKNKYNSIYHRVEDNFLKKKAEQIKKITEDLVHQLSYEGHLYFREMHEPRIIVANTLTASDLIELEQGHVMGIVLENTDIHSFGIALAKSWGIPAIIGIKHIVDILNEDEEIIIDGKKGELIIHPDKESKEIYTLKEKNNSEFSHIYKKYINKETCTKDGYKLKLNAVASSITDIHQAIEYGADDIGIYRTEAIFIGRSQMPDEESQFLHYKEAVEAANGKMITFRTFDCHGTSDLPYLYSPEQINPSLGLFSTRIALTHREILLIQIKAILRAGIYGKVRFVIPMIASTDELLDIRLLIEDAILDLDVNHIDYCKNMPFGVVLETPSVALITHIFAQELNFIYVDLDDLLQYTTGVDPSNEMTFDLYDEFHPGFIRLLKSMVRGAHREGTPIEFVGDICANELLIPFFIAMGVDVLTAEASQIAQMRWEINSMKKREWAKIMREIYFMGSANDIKMRLEKKYGEFFLWK